MQIPHRPELLHFEFCILHYGRRLLLHRQSQQNSRAPGAKPRPPRTDSATASCRASLRVCVRPIALLHQVPFELPRSAARRRDGCKTGGHLRIVLAAECFFALGGRIDGFTRRLLHLALEAFEIRDRDASAQPALHDVLLQPRVAAGVFGTARRRADSRSRRIPRAASSRWRRQPSSIPCARSRASAP